MQMADAGDHGTTHKAPRQRVVAPAHCEGLPRHDVGPDRRRADRALRPRPRKPRPSPGWRVAFDPPGLGHYELDVCDAVFTVALLVWWGVTGVHPYMIPGADYERNELEDRRVPFDGPVPLGKLLERALVADRDTRGGVITEWVSLIPTS